MPPRGRPGLHPDPPPDFARRRLLLAPISAPLYRIHSVRHRPVFFGKTGDNRFDDSRRVFGVLYAGLTPDCAFVETFSEELAFPFVTERRLAERILTRIELAAPVRVVDLRGAHLRQLGADARLLAGEHAPAQRWSRAIFEHPAAPDGILYRARHDPAQSALALFERARRALRPHRTRRALTAPENADLLARLLKKYGLGLLPK